MKRQWTRDELADHWTLRPKELECRIPRAATSNGGTRGLHSTGAAQVPLRVAIAGWLAQRAAGVHTVVVDTGAAEVVLDTNVFVAAGFNPGSHSARLVEAVRERRLRMVWDDATRTEVEHVMRQIPRLSWTRIADLFRSEDRFGGSTHPEKFGFVPDPADRKFAALADAAQVPLVTSDAVLLKADGQMTVRVLRPSEFTLRSGVLDGESGLS